jgi:hypothetical protein
MLSTSSSHPLPRPQQDTPPSSTDEDGSDVTFTTEDELKAGGPLPPPQFTSMSMYAQTQHQPDAVMANTPPKTLSERHPLPPPSPSSPGLRHPSLQDFSNYSFVVSEDMEVDRYLNFDHIQDDAPPAPPHYMCPKDLYIDTNAAQNSPSPPALGSEMDELETVPQEATLFKPLLSPQLQYKHQHLHHQQDLLLRPPMGDTLPLSVSSTSLQNLSQFGPSPTHPSESYVSCICCC